MADAQKPEVSDEQAADALRQLMGKPQSEPGTQEDTPVTLVQETPEKQEEEPQEVAEAPKDTETQEEQEVEAEESDDIAALKASLEEMRTQNESIRSSASKSLQWAKDLALKKSTETDRLTRFLQNLVNQDDIDKAEIQRVLQGTAPSQPHQDFQNQAMQPQPVQSDEFTAMDEQLFLLDNPMNNDQYQEFHKFIQTADIPEAFVPGNTYATLSRFYNAFRSQHKSESQEKAKAVKSIQRAQTKARRAAGSISSKGSPSPAPEAPKDFRQMSVKEIEDTPNLLSELFRRSIEE